MGNQSESAPPPPITCAKCGGTWSRVWVVRREIEQCPYCRADLEASQATELLRRHPAPSV